MTELNIFQTIRNTTHRIEPFHSQFLGDALRASLAGDRSLFEGIWNLCAPADWAPPQSAEVTNESRLVGAQRIDILIVDKATGCVVGIEVKTSRASARSGQLEGLRIPCKVATCSNAKLPPSPTQSSHLFQFKMATFDRTGG